MNRTVTATLTASLVGLLAVAPSAGPRDTRDVQRSSEPMIAKEDGSGEGAGHPALPKPAQVAREGESGGAGEGHGEGAGHPALPEPLRNQFA